MADTAVFETLAEIGIALAGFTGIVMALGHRARGEWSPTLRARLRDLLCSSLGVVFFSFLPRLLSELVNEPLSAWRLAHSLFALFHLGTMVLFFKGARLRLVSGRLPRAILWLFTPPGLAVLAGQFAVAFGHLPEEAFFVYFLALLWLLLIGAIQFSLLLMSGERAVY